MARSGLSIKLDLQPLVNLLERSPEAAGRGAKRAMGDIKDDWVRGARDIGPLDTGNLRRQISGKQKGSGLEGEVIVTANATSKSGGRRFNYSYYIHEGGMAADGKHLRTPGTVEEFLAESADRSEERWKAMLENEIREELNRAGW